MPTPEGAFGLGGEIPVMQYGKTDHYRAGRHRLFRAVGTLAGYAFSRFSFRGKNALFLGFMLGRAIPGITLSLPLFVLFARAGLSDTIQGMIFIYTALNIPFTAWLIDGFSAIQEELDDAARIDGCSYRGAFWRVALPLALPGRRGRVHLCLLDVLE